MTSRRSFLKLAGAAPLILGAAAVRPPAAEAQAALPQGPEVWLGRVAWPWGVNVLRRPRPEGALVRTVMPEELVVIRREIVGVGMMPHNHVWYELDDGYVYSSYVQPARNWPQPPAASVPAEGQWAEVYVPFVDGRSLPAADAPVLYRFYYSAVYRVTEAVSAADGSRWYRVGTEIIPNMYAPAEAFRFIAPEELAPLSPEVADKRLLVNLSRQTITAFEGQAEVFRARISSGAQFFGADGRTLVGGTGLGRRYIWQKRVSRQMQGGTVESGWDLPGVAWVAYFASNGEALHSTYWHNDFGRPKSRGCINLRPADAQWLFRWTAPTVAYNPGDIIVDWDHRGTLVDIQVES
ncbi:MAG: L,D-transpeptidase [Anaerolineales bacterium]|nr:L,D-transpeptidase [Anaerolineales bacterium]